MIDGQNLDVVQTNGRRYACSESGDLQGTSGIRWFTRDDIAELRVPEVVVQGVRVAGSFISTGDWSTDVKTALQYTDDMRVGWREFDDPSAAQETTDGTLHDVAFSRNTISYVVRVRRVRSTKALTTVAVYENAKRSRCGRYFPEGAGDETTERTTARGTLALAAGETERTSAPVQAEVARGFSISEWAYTTTSSIDVWRLNIAGHERTRTHLYISAVGGTSDRCALTLGVGVEAREGTDNADILSDDVLNGIGDYTYTITGSGSFDLSVAASPLDSENVVPSTCTYTVSMRALAPAP